jgi:hypothetical protein
MSENTKILVCAHKKDYAKSDDIYMPIHAGKAISNLDLGFQGDNTGENISEKNQYYCELTVHYWAWKNLKNIDYIGLNHYRRYFDLSSIRVNNTLKFDRIFHNHDIILAAPSYTPYSNLFHIIEGTTREDIYILIHIISIYYPTYKQAILDYLYNSNQWIGGNMFITSKKCFEEYSKWLFDILSITEKQIKISEYTRLKRIFGYMGEVLLPIYCIANNLRIKYLNVYNNPDEVKKISFFKKLKYDVCFKLRYNICFKLIQPFKLKEISIPDSTLIGFNKDKNYVA